MNIEDHPLAKNLPKATETASIQLGPQHFRAFAAREDAPATLEDFVHGDTPQLSLHITSFNNATLVALSWPHTLMDVMGQQALLRGWSLVLAGREEEVPPVLGTREDAVCAAVNAAEKQEEFKLGEKQLVGWGLLRFGLHFVWDLLWNQVVETRTIFLPKEAMAKLRSQAQEDLASASQDGGEELPFVSEGDVLTAWTTRAVVSSLPQPRPVTVLHALNARFRIPALAQAPGVYLQNMVVAACTFLSPEMAMGPLGAIALENRRHVMEQSTESQVLAFLRKLQNGANKSENHDPALVLCGDPNAVLMPVTNWTRAEFFKTADFSPAVLSAVSGANTQQPSRSNSPGTMVYQHAQSMRQGAATRNVVVVLGRDHGDNYWLTGILLPRAWAKLEEEVMKL